jgi:hypothetical protein
VKRRREPVRFPEPNEVDGIELRCKQWGSSRPGKAVNPSINSKRFNQIDCRCRCKQIMTSRGVGCFVLSWICPWMLAQIMEDQQKVGWLVGGRAMEGELPNSDFLGPPKHEEEWQLLPELGVVVCCLLTH